MWSPWYTSRMNHTPDIHRRRSIRLKGYDYSRTGAYFVTIVTQGRTCRFGDVSGEEMCLNDAGRMACRLWESLPLHFPGIEIDAFIVMPNHIHGIIVGDQDNPVEAPLVGAQEPSDVGPPETGAIESPEARATTRVAPTGGHVTLGRIVGAYKSLTTLEYSQGVKTHSWLPFEGRLWQRNYYEHIVRNDESLRRVRQYIIDNPAQWIFDRENPQAVSGLHGKIETPIRRDTESSQQETAGLDRGVL